MKVRIQNVATKQNARAQSTDSIWINFNRVVCFGDDKDDVSEVRINRCVCKSYGSVAMATGDTITVRLY